MNQPEYRFTTDWFSRSVPVWEQHLSRFSGERSLSFVEIGSWEGRSAAWLLENILTDASSTLHCVDPWDRPSGPEAESAFDHNMQVVQRYSPARVVKHKGRSADILPTFPANSANLVYVDGSHVAKDVLTDIVLSWRLLPVGGLLVCDDYGLTQGVQFDGGREIYVVASPSRRPKPAIDAFLKCFIGDYRLLHKDWQVIVEKVA